MSYPIGTAVHTVLLDSTPLDGNLASPVVVVVLDADGEVRATSHNDYRAAQSFCRNTLDYGGRVLAVVEGEHDLSTGECTAWTTRH